LGGQLGLGRILSKNFGTVKRCKKNEQDRLSAGKGVPGGKRKRGRRQTIKKKFD